ncbi:MAG: HD domain-containing protein, partial [Armatimonadaceae bacterium]
MLTPDEMRQLRAGREHLWKTRHALHIVANERRDRLSIARQEALAERFGIAGDDYAPPVEKWMANHYEHAATVDRLGLKVMSRCLDAPLNLGSSGLASLRRTVVITEPAAAEANPLWPLEAMRHCQEYDLELAPATVESIESLGTDFRTPDAGRMLVDLLGEDGDIHRTFRRLERCGLLARMLPELSDCLRLIPYDPAHGHTVGEHTLRAIANISRLRPEAPPEPALEAYRYVYTTLESPATLILALALHDIGKQWPRDRHGRRAPHEVTGSERVQEICGRLGCNQTMTDRVTLLVRHHLLLAEISRLRDLSRPETIGEVLTVVPDSDMLCMLYLLTWADTSAVGPGVWSSASARLLDELVQRCEARIGSESTSDPAQ